jgi:hypothetical protein
MLYRLHRSLRGVFALSVGFIAVIAGAYLNAAHALAQVPPPESVPTSVHNPSASAATHSGPLWTYVLVACAALLIGAAISYALTRSQKRPPSRGGRTERDHGGVSHASNTEIPVASHRLTARSPCGRHKPSARCGIDGVRYSILFGVVRSPNVQLRQKDRVGLGNRTRRGRAPRS